MKRYRSFLLERVLNRSTSIRMKLTLAVTLLIGIIALFVFLYFPTMLERQVLALVSEKAQSIALVSSYSIGPALYFQDTDAIQEALLVARQNKDLVYMVVTDTLGNTLGAFDQNRADRLGYRSISRQEGWLSQDQQVYHASVPILINEQHEGHLYLGLSLQTVQAAVQSSHTSIAWVSLLLFLTGMAGVAVISTFITRPLGEITQAVDEIAQGKLEKRARITTRDEVARLARLLNHMVEQLIMAKEQAEEMARLKNSFLANMSHEIRTPLNGILGFTQLLQTELEGEQREFADLIESSGRRLLETINSVLEMARLESGHATLKEEEVNLVEEVSRTITLLAPLAQEKGLYLEMKAPANVWALVDSPAIHRVVNNLVGNALKFTHQGGILVELNARNRDLILRVRDTGIGIEEEFMPHLFNEFKQESSGYARSHEGTGLGLAITQRLVKLMGGTIEVASRKHVGSVFTVVLPGRICPAPLPPMPDPTKPSLPVSSQSHTILILDDNLESRIVLQKMLGGHYRCQVAATPAESFDLASSQTFDLLLLDINLKDPLTGVDVLQQLRSQPQYQRTPAVALTAFALPGDRERFLEAGFDAYLAKPVLKADLEDTLHRLLTSEQTVDRIRTPYPGNKNPYPAS
jgi:signal transduction histidine kinase/CheY-like chemotaxis protein